MHGLQAREALAARKLERLGLRAGKKDVCFYVVSLRGCVKSSFLGCILCADIVAYRHGDASAAGTYAVPAAGPCVT